MITQHCVQCGAELGEKDHFCTECGAPRSRPQDHTLQSVKNTNKLSLPVIVLIAGVLLLLGGALVYLLGGSEAAPVVSEAPAGVVESDIPYPEVARISVEEATASAEAGTAVIVDVRSREDYETLHVTNALSIPLDELPGRYTELPQGAEILTYCT